RVTSRARYEASGGSMCAALARSAAVLRRHSAAIAQSYAAISRSRAAISRSSAAISRSLAAMLSPAPSSAAPVNWRIGVESGPMVLETVEIREESFVLQVGVVETPPMGRVAVVVPGDRELPAHDVVVRPGAADVGLGEFAGFHWLGGVGAGGLPADDEVREEPLILGVVRVERAPVGGCALPVPLDGELPARHYLAVHVCPVVANIARGEGFSAH